MASDLFQPPAHRSYSQVTTYVRCGKQYQLTRVLRAPERPSVYLVGGSAVHDVIEHLCRRKHAQPDIEAIDADTLADLWLSAWKLHADRVAEESGITDPAEWRSAGRKTKDKPNGEDADWWISEGHQMVARCAAWLDTQYEQGMVIFEDDHGPWIERGLTVPIGGVPTKMFLDAVFVMPGGELLVVDWKGLDLNTPIPTPSGWTTMGAARVGDEVFGSDGQPCRIVAKSEVKRIGTYIVKFDDGSEIVCDSEHIWWTQTTGEDAPTAKPISEVIRTLVKYGQKNHRVPVAGPLGLPDVRLPIDPYLLGCWLGDGHKRDGCITKTDELFELLESDGHTLGIRQAQPEGKEHIATRTVAGLSTALGHAGLRGHKQIPAEYLRAGTNQRMRLLQGLMDTDGSWNIARNRAVFSTTDKALALQVQELILSLGERAHLAEAEKHGFGLTVTGYEIEFTPRDWVPFRIASKADKCKDGMAGKRHAFSSRRMIVDVVPGPDVETACIGVDSPDNTYLCGEQMIPTHNTGSRTPKHTQLSLYALGMQQAHAPRPPLGAYWMARTGELSAPSSLPESFDLVLSAMFEQADLGIRAGIFIPNTDAYCDSCSVNKFCAAYGGVEANQYDPIILDHA